MGVVKIDGKVYKTETINTLPEGIRQMKNIVELEILNTGLTTLPEWIGELTKLKSLELQINRKLTHLPASIGNLVNLERLILRTNILTRLPASIGNLRNLENLELNNNKLTTLPASIGNLTKLRTLDLSGNKLTTLPTSIGKLRNLEDLNLYLNKLTTLPESIGKLTELEYLNLSDNKLTTLPESIGNLKKLKEISLDLLKSLPNSFATLSPNMRVVHRFKYGGFVVYKTAEFLTRYKRLITKNTELFNANFMPTTRISNIPPNKRVFINRISNVTENGKLRRVYNRNSISAALRRGGGRVRLHGGEFTRNNVEYIGINANKNVYLRNIKNRLLNAPLNNYAPLIRKIKSNLPANVSRNDVNAIVRNIKPQLMTKIGNKLKITPPGKRANALNTYKYTGLINQNDVKKLQ